MGGEKRDYSAAVPATETAPTAARGGRGGGGGGGVRGPFLSWAFTLIKLIIFNAAGIVVHYFGVHSAKYLINLNRLGDNLRPPRTNCFWDAVG